jgi:hypothetical protein
LQQLHSQLVLHFLVQESWFLHSLYFLNVPFWQGLPL